MADISKQGYFSFLVCMVLVPKAVGTCNETTLCTTDDGNTGICIDNICTSSIKPATREHLEFEIIARYPETNLKKTTDLYIRGNGLGLDWTVGKIMTKISHDTWKVIIKYQSIFNGFRCQECTSDLLLEGKLEYRILADDSVDMIGGNFVVNLPVSMTSSYFEGNPTISVFPWFYTRTGTTNNFTINSTEIGKSRQISLYLPPSYGENSFKKYPKIFAFDLFPGLYVDLIKSSLDSVIETGTTKEFIIIGYGDFQPVAERNELLTPYPGSVIGCLNGTFTDLCDHCLPKNYTLDEFHSLMVNKCGRFTPINASGDHLLDFLINTVLPRAQELTNNRILTDQPNTGIMGYSLGGLMSCYAAWTRSSVFGMAACQSPSLWWPYDDMDENKCLFDFINITLENQDLNTNRYPQRILLDAGSEEASSPYKLTQSTVEAGLKMLQHQNFVLNRNLWINIYPESSHSLIEWDKRIWKPLQTLLPSDGATGMQTEMINQANDFLISSSLVVIPLLKVCFDYF